ncbi:M61 glycyl aminopeptidase [Brevundimonas sp. SH203]|uniref:M61 family metallopeptidase n=1 Tax=Brevundimonas sp. SH203 TaxID=345167 RepID=UPI0009D30407|nr:M61 family metallopeptidase [Brevundimonas sp. SH203]GAW40199.1 M61 glycyl aminopeptidase [Brevundimonas sp. SH203]
MITNRLRVAGLALLLVSAAPAALAQQASTYAPALPAPQPPIPDAQDVAYPGVIALDVDATNLSQRIFSVKETIPVAQAGPMVLYFPQWLPGEHGPTGPIPQLAGLEITANGQRVEWVRDTLRPFAYHIVVPAGATALDVKLQHLSPTAGAQGRITMTPEMLNIQWEKMLLYPAGHWSRNIMVQPTVRFPAGWSFGTALEPQTKDGDRQTFRPVNLEVLIDSPVFAGVHYRQIDLDPGGRSPVRANIFADEADNLEATDEQVQILRNLVTQMDRLYGARHFDHYDFLIAMTDKLGGIGLEHHRSSENSVDPEFFTGWSTHLGDRDLLSHEMNHSWDGKWRRPADQYVPNFNSPLQNSLLWVYEGQTQYYGQVIAARSGLLTTQQALDSLAMTAATYDTRIGRQWRALQDTTNDPIISQRQAKGWLSWQRDEDYYSEGQLIWLDVDTLIREKTNGRKSLDDFARAFYGVQDGSYTPAPYTFEDVVAALNGVVANDWATFLRARLDADGPNARAPLDGLARGGWRLTFADKPTDYMKTLYSELKRNDFTYSLGLQTGENNKIRSVQWDGPAFKAGLAVGMEIVAVGGQAATADRLSAAVTAAKDPAVPVTLIVKDDDQFRTVVLDYHDGLRYPRLERIPGTPDRLTDILTPRKR